MPPITLAEGFVGGDDMHPRFRVRWACGRATVTYLAVNQQSGRPVRQ